MLLQRCNTQDLKYSFRLYIIQYVCLETVYSDDEWTTGKFRTNENISGTPFTESRRQFK